MSRWRDRRCGGCGRRRSGRSRVACGRSIPGVPGLELPGANPLKDAHAALAAAVLAAYGFSHRDDLLAQLLDLNLTVARPIESGQTVTAPGAPPGYPEPQRLVTSDCIRP